MKVLVVGETISAESTLGSTIKYPSILEKTINNCTIDNKSAISLSDREIMYSVYNSVMFDSYDLIIVQFGLYLRLSMPVKDMEHTHPFCLMNGNSPYKLFDSEWRGKFINRHQSLTRWLTDVTILTDWLSNNKQKFIIIRGFDNYFDDLSKTEWKLSSTEYKKLVLDVDSLPDDILDQKHNVLNCKFNLLKRSAGNNWLNFTTPSIINSMIDLCQDEEHLIFPGANTHQEIANMVKSKAKSLGFL